jgi:anti-anti-sigma regulatory factor
MRSLAAINTDPILIEIRGSRHSSNVASIYSACRPPLESDVPRYVTIDLSEVTFIAPCAIAALSVILQHADQKGLVMPQGGRLVAPSRPNVAQYLHVMNFYALLGLELPGAHARPMRVGFMPAEHIPPNPEPTASGDVARRLVDTVKDRCELETRADSTLWSSLSEVVDNVQHHSKSEIGAVAVAASWPKRNRIELAVADAGVGIPKALSANPYLVGVSTPEQAMLACIQRGVSGLVQAGRGNGLWQVSEILRRNQGTLTLLSDSTRLTVTGSGVSTHASQKVVGTLAIMRFNMEIPVNLADILVDDAAELDDFVEFSPWDVEEV